MQFNRPFWVRFDVEDRGCPAPAFCLPGVDQAGNDLSEICLSDYRGQSSLALFFAPVQGCDPCMNMLEKLDEQVDAYRAEGAQTLAIFPPGEIQNLGKNLLSFPSLIDANSAVRAKYAGLMAAELVEESDGLLFLLDEFGAPYTVLVGAEQAAERLHSEVLGWLQFIGMQCPE